jgi:nicotinate-nucleotide pyrophosphorylase (carboxylating)
VLACERVLLNFLQRLSGVATATRAFVDAVADTAATIYDTRKTTPGWRDLEKYAVRCGGAQNHRFGLHDAILVKDNHLVAVQADRLSYHAFELLSNVANLDPPPAYTAFEVDSPAQLEQLLKVVGLDIIMLDNFSIEDIHRAIALRNDAGAKGKIELEVSGGVTLDTVRIVAQTGVERIAVGALTHSAAALDISMDLKA